MEVDEKEMRQPIRAEDLVACNYISSVRLKPQSVHVQKDAKQPTAKGKLVIYYYNKPYCRACSYGLDIDAPDQLNIPYFGRRLEFLSFLRPRPIPRDNNAVRLSKRAHKGTPQCS